MGSKNWANVLRGVFWWPIGGGGGRGGVKPLATYMWHLHHFWTKEDNRLFWLYCMHFKIYVSWYCHFWPGSFDQKWTKPEFNKIPNLILWNAGKHTVQMYYTITTLFIWNSEVILKIKSTLQDFIILLKNTISLSLSLGLRASVDFFTGCRYEFLLALLSLRKKRDY